MNNPTILHAKQPALPDQRTNSSPARSIRKSPAVPTLRFTPTAWAKLLFMRDAGETEVGGFAISMADDPALIADFQLVRQICDVASVSFDDNSVADFFDECVDAGLKPCQVGRIWVHTHPGSCPQPSPTDEDTFARVFGGANWALMFILARGGQTFARLQFNVGPRGSVNLPFEIDFSRPFKASDHAAWRDEYLANVEVFEWQPTPAEMSHSLFDPRDDGLWPDLFDDQLDDFARNILEREYVDDF
jgi:hypothetical protein